MELGYIWNNDRPTDQTICDGKHVSQQLYSYFSIERYFGICFPLQSRVRRRRLLVYLIPVIVTWLGILDFLCDTMFQRLAKIQRFTIKQYRQYFEGYPMFSAQSENDMNMMITAAQSTMCQNCLR